MDDLFSSLLFPILSADAACLEDHVHRFLQPKVIALFSNTKYSSETITLRCVTFYTLEAPKTWELECLTISVILFQYLQSGIGLSA